MLAQNPVNGFVFDQPVVIKGGAPFIRSFTSPGDLPIKAKRRRSISSICSNHVLTQPPTTTYPRTCACSDSVSGTRGRKSAAVADSKDIDLTRVDEIVILQRAKRGAITGQFRFKIIFGTIAFAVADTLFVHTKKTEAGQLRNLSKCQASRVMADYSWPRILVRRRFNRVATEPSGNEDHRQFSASLVRLGDDRSQSFAAWSSYRVVNYVDIGIGFTRRFRPARKVVCSGSLRDYRELPPRRRLSTPLSSECASSVALFFALRKGEYLRKIRCFC